VTPAVICAPLRAEWAALRLGGLRPRHTGMGPGRSERAARAIAGGPVLVAGVAGGLADGVRPGDVVVADEVRGHPDGPVPVPAAAVLAAALRRLGLTVHIGPIVSEPRVTHGAHRARLAATGALAVDTETAWLAVRDRPFAAVRSIVDTADSPLWSLGTPRRGLVALNVLRRAAPALAAWSAACLAGPGPVTLAGPGPVTVHENEEVS
jgi:4-hydroxy-3-methylbut-2-enyl diphosphate reductase